VVPPAVSPPPPVPPTPGSPAGTPQSLAGEPAGGGAPAATPGDQTVDPNSGKTPEKIASGITSKPHVILHQKRLGKPKRKHAQSCSLIASCKAPEPYPRGAAAAPTRGGVRELPPPQQVTATGLARGRAVRHVERPARPKRVRQPGGAGSAPAPLIPAPPGRSPEAPPPSALTFSSSGTHGTGSAAVSASVSAFGVAATRAPTTAVRSTSVPLRRRGSDERIDRPG
jgi:hypothetical protein